MTEVCEPEFPPVSISMGMKEVKITMPASTLSKCEMMDPVNVAEIMSSSSHGTRFFASVHTLDLRYS